MAAAPTGGHAGRCGALQLVQPWLWAWLLCCPARLCGQLPHHQSSPRLSVAAPSLAKGVLNQLRCLRDAACEPCGGSEGQDNSTQATPPL
jgi:hypothetical protein